MNKSVKAANLRMLQIVAKQLGTSCEEVVFLGGSTIALFITDPASPDVRYILDVDCIVDVISLNQYHYGSIADGRINILLKKVEMIALCNNS